MPDSHQFDPDLFDPKNISKETSDFNKKIDELFSSIPPIYTLSPQTLRNEQEGGLGLWPMKLVDGFKNRVVSAAAGEVPVRVFTPQSPKGVYLHMHGGGFMMGRAHHQDEGLHMIATRCNVAVVSVDYRLSPEHPYPAGPEDCEAAAVWLAENAKKEFNTDRLIIGGESAGANLSVVTLLRMRDKHGFENFSGANLVYGVYDQAQTPSAKNFGEKPNHMITTKLMAWFHDNYAPGNLQKDPDVSPLYAELSHMPPALFTVGTLDPLLDDSLFMHTRWAAAGNRSELAVYPGGTHAFNTFPIQIAAQANKKISEFIKNSIR